jgi:electron transfer flavoprotein beta subunit
VATALAGYAKDKGFDLLLMGNKGMGGDNAAVGPMLAELLGLAQANVVVKFELTDTGFRAEREIEGGTEVVEGALPAVVTAQKGLNEPRYASLKGIMAAKKKIIEEVEGTGPEGATAVAALLLPAARPEGRKLDGDPAAQAAALFSALRDEAKVL